MGFILGIDIRCLSPVELWVRHLIKNDLKCSLPAWLPFCFFFLLVDGSQAAAHALLSYLYP